MCVLIPLGRGGDGALLNNEVHESGNVAYGDGAVSIHVACIILFGCSENHVHQFGYVAHVHYAVAIDVAGNYVVGSVTMSMLLSKFTVSTYSPSAIL